MKLNGLANQDWLKTVLANTNGAAKCVRAAFANSKHHALVKAIDALSSAIQSEDAEYYQTLKTIRAVEDTALDVHDRLEQATPTKTNKAKRHALDVLVRNAFALRDALELATGIFV